MAEPEKASGIKQVEPSEKEAKQVVRDIMNQEKDVFEVRGGDPKLEYYWGPTRSDRLEGEKWRRGFEVCTDPKVQTLHRKPDGTHQAGDAVLMQRPVELGDLERKRNAGVSRAHQKKDRKEFEDLARQQGVKTFKE